MNIEQEYLMTLIIVLRFRLFEFRVDTRTSLNHVYIVQVYAL